MTVIAANADRYPVSAQCEILGVPRSTYYYLRSHPPAPAAPDPVEPDALAAHAEGKGRCGARRVKASLERRGVSASRRRISRIMRENGLSSAYGRKRFKAHPGKPNEADLPNLVAREFGGRAPRTHACSDLTYVRVAGSWCYVCLLIDLDNFKTVNDTLGHPEGDRVIQEFADVLLRVFPRDALVGRMGGDEFAVFSTCPLSVEEAQCKACELIEAWGSHSASRAVELGCSVGIVRVVRGETFFDLYRAADCALYASKDNGKGCYSW